MMKKNKALIISNDPKVVSGITDALTREAISTDFGDRLETGFARLKEASYVVAFLDGSLCSSNPAQAVLRLARLSPEIRIVYLCSLECTDEIALALAAGALAHLSKPLDPFDVVQTFRRVITMNPRPVTAMTDEEQRPAAMKEGQTFCLLGVSDHVGKTTLAVNLAAALAMREADKVCIVDLDLQFGDVCRYLGIEPRSTLASFAKDWSGAGGVKKHITGWRNNIDMLAAPTHPELAETVTQEMVQAVLQQLRHEYAYVIVDTAFGFNEVNLAAIDAVDTILLIGVIDSIATVKNTKACIDTLQKLGCPAVDIKLILNKHGAKPSLERNDVEKALGRGFDIALPDELQTISEAIATKDTIFTSRQNKGLSAAITRLADSLRPRTTEVAKPTWSFAQHLYKLLAKKSAKNLTN